MDSSTSSERESRYPLLFFNKRKPFSSLLWITLLVVLGCTAITVLKFGFVWTSLFALVITVIGAASFLVIADDENGGIAAETRKVLSSAESPLIRRFATLLHTLNGTWADKSTSFSTRTNRERMMDSSPDAVVTSANLEKLCPWYNLKIPRLIDDSLLSLTRIIVHTYALKDWYASIQVRKTFVSELESAVRHATSLLVRRMRTIQYPKFIVEKVIPAFVDHISVFLTVNSLQRQADSTIDLNALLAEQPQFFHPALVDHCEIPQDTFVYRLSAKLTHCLVPEEVRRFSPMSAIFREVLSESVLKLIVDLASEPHRIYFLLTLAADSVMTPEDSPIFDSTEEEAAEVPILEGLRLGIEKSPSTVQKLTLKDILKEPALKNSFEQHLKDKGLEDFLKIYESMSWISKFLESPVLGEAAVLTTFNSATKLLKQIQSTVEKEYSFPKQFLVDLKAFTSGAPSAVLRLRQCSSWSECFHQLISLVENIFVPGFEETRLYHHLLIPPTEEANRKRQVRRNFSRRTARPANPEPLRMLGETVRGVLKDVPAVIDNQYSNMDDDLDGSSLPDDDFEETDHADHSINEDALGSALRDLSFYDVTVLRAERRRDDRGRIFMMLNFSIFDRGPLSPDKDKKWTIQRRYAEFYVLENKLREFHGDLMVFNHLPPKKAWTGPSLEYMQLKIPDFQRFLRALVSEPKLRYSQMLYNFLATTMEFDSSLGFPDLGLGKVIRNVPQILTQERGQNIDTFVRSLLSSALPTVVKQKPHTEGLSDSLVTSSPAPSQDRSRSRTDSLKSYNLSELDKNTQDGKSVQGMFDQIIYLATNLFRTEPEVLSLIACLHVFAAPLVEKLAHDQISNFVKFAQDPRQLSSMINTLCDTLTCEDASVTEREILQREADFVDRVRKICRTETLKLVSGLSPEDLASLMLSLFQYKTLNMRLVLILLDLLVSELFPEFLSSLSDSSSSVVKSTVSKICS